MFVLPNDTPTDAHSHIHTTQFRHEVHVVNVGRRWQLQINVQWETEFTITWSVWIKALAQILVVWRKNQMQAQRSKHSLAYRCVYVCVCELTRRTKQECNVPFIASRRAFAPVVIQRIKKGGMDVTREMSDARARYRRSSSRRQHTKPSSWMRRWSNQRPRYVSVTRRAYVKHLTCSLHMRGDTKWWEGCHLWRSDAARSRACVEWCSLLEFVYMRGVQCALLPGSRRVILSPPRQCERRVKAIPTLQSQRHATSALCTDCAGTGRGVKT